MTSDTKYLEQLDQKELARFVIDLLRRTALHYGFWFNEVQHQLGLEEALRLEEEAFAQALPIVVRRLSKAMGFAVKDELPLSLAEMPKEKLIGLIEAMSLNWLAIDGVWFQSVETRRDMLTAKRCNDTCWTRYSPL
jgi:hypothetical protein